jgi:hypothetical protein
MRQVHDLIAPYVAAEAYPYSCSTTLATDFPASLVGGANALETHVAARHTAVEAALATP